MISIYTDIASLFDLRLAVVHRLSEAQAAKLATNPLYYARLNDNLWEINHGINKDAYIKAYKEMDLEDLQNAVLTPIFDEIEDMCRIDLMQNIFGNMDSSYKLTINIYPFSFNSEQKEEFIDNLKKHCSYDDVKLMRLPPEFLTTDNLKGYTHCFIYNLDEWVSKHFSDLQLGELTGVSVVSPPMFIKKPDQDKIGAIIEQNKRAWQPFFFYNPMPISQFCMTLPDDATIVKKKRRK